MLQKKYDDIQSLLLSGTCLMLEHKEVNAGTELGLLLLEVYRISSPKITTAIFGMKLIIFEIVLQLIVLQTQLSKCILSTQKEQTLERSVSLRMPPSMWKSDSLPYIDSFHHNNFFLYFIIDYLLRKKPSPSKWRRSITRSQSRSGKRRTMAAHSDTSSRYTFIDCIVFNYYF